MTLRVMGAAAAVAGLPTFLVFPEAGLLACLIGVVTGFALSQCATPFIPSRIQLCRKIQELEIREAQITDVIPRAERGAQKLQTLPQLHERRETEKTTATRLVPNVMPPYSTPRNLIWLCIACCLTICGFVILLPERHTIHGGSGMQEPLSRMPDPAAATPSDYGGHKIQSEAPITHPQAIRSEFPIRWAIGSVDSRFGVSTGKFLSLTYLGTLVWQSQVDAFLFRYDANQPQLTVNLVYDERQELQTHINRAAAAADAWKRLYEPRMADYGAQVAAYNKENADAEQERRRYEDQRLHWETQGGAPADELRRLEAWCRAGNDEVERLRQTGAVLDASRRELQLLAEQVRTRIADHNALLSSRTNTRAGECRRSNDTTTVDVYCFANEYELLVILTHELGHALGVREHLSNEGSLLFGTNMVGKSVLTPDDVAAVKDICVHAPKTQRVDRVYMRHLNEYLQEYQSGVIRAAADRGAYPPLPVPREMDPQMLDP